MTWLKLPDDFDDRCDDLSDAAYRTHVNALLYVMRRELGSRFPKRMLRRIAQTADPGVAVTSWLHAGSGRTTAGTSRSFTA